MRIGFMASHADGGKSGIAQYEINLMRQLRQIGTEHEMHLFVNRDHMEPFADTYDSVHPAPGALARPIPSLIWHQTALPAAARRARLDLLHLSSHQRLTFLKGCRTVGTIHDLGGFVISEKYSSSRMLYLKKVIPVLARRLDGILTDSDFSKQEIIRLIGIDAAKIRVIHLGYNADRFAPVDPEWAQTIARDRHGLPEHYFVYVARLEHPSKNHVALVEAFAHLRQKLDCPHKLVFVGRDWNGEAEIRARVAAHGLDDHVVFQGHVANDDLPPILAAAEAFVFPSLFEGFGIPPVEAMACGAPVICSDAACLPEVVGDAALLVDARNPEFLCDAMTRVLEDPTVSDTLREKGFERCKQFTWRQTAQKTLKVYNEILRN